MNSVHVLYQNQLGSLSIQGLMENIANKGLTDKDEKIMPAI